MWGDEDKTYYQDFPEEITSFVYCDSRGYIVMGSQTPESNFYLNIFRLKSHKKMVKFQHFKVVFEQF
jgi:hypothetical protein